MMLLFTFNDELSLIIRKLTFETNKIVLVVQINDILFT